MAHVERTCKALPERVSSPVTPKITVFIPVYNRERYVAEAIDSVLAQTFPDFELLVVDDGSTDATRTVVAAYDDPRVRLVCNERNLGIPATRNRGLAEARGEYIALLDSDDWCYPQRLGRQAAFLDANPDYAEIGTWGRAMDSEGRPLRSIQYRPVAPDDVKVEFLFRCAVKNRSVMGRTALLRAYGYREDYARCQDYDMHVRIAREWRVGNLPQILVRGRNHPGRWTSASADLGRRTKLDIMARQLDDIGLPYSSEDVERHYLMPRPEDAPQPLGADYLRWAEDWLRRLQEANARSGFLAEAALQRALAIAWLQLCWQLRPDEGRLSQWRRLPLSRGLVGGFSRKLRELALFAAGGTPHQIPAG